LGKALAEKSWIWAVSSADTAQIEGFLRDHPAAVLPDTGTKLGQGFAQALAEKPSTWRDHPAAVLSDKRTKLGQGFGHALAEKLWKQDTRKTSRT
jgi:hypothetical protein